MKKKVLIVLGGFSKERKVSLATGKACTKAIKRLGYQVQTLDPAKISLTKIKRSKVDIIFNALHGKGGEDGEIQKFFEIIKIPYTHSGPVSSYNSMNKIISTNFFKKKNILVPKRFVLEKDASFASVSRLIKKSNIDYPVVAKPSDEGSSIGVKICNNSKALKKSINSLGKIYKTLIIEKYIGGQEIQVAVINRKAIGAIELKPKRGFYDYKAKYYKSAKTDHIMPANVSKKKYKEVLKIAEKAHKTLRCRGVTRSDFKFFKNKFYLLEINTQPGMTDLSLVPEIAKHVGISFDTLVKKMILDAGINKY